MTKAEALALSAIYYLPLPDDIHGCTIETKSGRFIIAINAALPEAQKAKTLNHELSHIMLNHFSDKRPLHEIEAEADRLAAAI